MHNTPKGSRIPVCSVKGSCPGPLDDGGEILYDAEEFYVKKQDGD